MNWTCAFLGAAMLMTAMAMPSSSAASAMAWLGQEGAFCVEGGTGGLDLTSDRCHESSDMSLSGYSAGVAVAGVAACVVVEPDDIESSDVLVGCGSFLCELTDAVCANEIILPV